MAREVHRFATDRGKTELYKFRPYDSDENRRRINEVIQEHKIYFARASQLNDPFDLSPRLEPITREALLAGAEDHYRRAGTLTSLKAQAALLYLRNCNLAEHAANVQRRSRRWMEQYWIFSLAGNRDHPMLWSHYAASHTGLCIHFATKDTVFGAAMEVTYADRRSLVPIQVRSLGHNELFNRIALVKGRFWHYEEEYRLIRFPDADFSDVGLQFTDQQFCFFRPYALSGITVGARMPEERVQEVCALASAHVPHIPVWRAVETDTYDFEFECLTPAP